MQKLMGAPLNPFYNQIPHRKLRQAGVEASLQVYEGQSHAHYHRDVSAPESKERSPRSRSFSTSTWANSVAYCRKMFSGRSALTVTFGTSTTLETRRSTATLQMT